MTVFSTQAVATYRFHPWIEGAYHFELLNTVAREWCKNRQKIQVNHTFDVSQVYLNKDSNLLPHLEDLQIPHTLTAYCKLIVPYVLANTTSVGKERNA